VCPFYFVFTSSISSSLEPVIKCIAWLQLPVSQDLEPDLSLKNIVGQQVDIDLSAWS
jgi:hypothetical protein